VIGSLHAHGMMMLRLTRRLICDRQRQTRTIANRAHVTQSIAPMFSKLGLASHAIKRPFAAHQGPFDRSPSHFKIAQDP